MRVLFGINSFNNSFLSQEHPVNIGFSSNVINTSDVVNHNIYFGSKKNKLIQSKEAIEEYKKMELRAKEQRQQLPVLLQIKYPLELYPKIKSNDINKMNSIMLMDKTNSDKLITSLAKFFQNDISAQNDIKQAEISLLKREEPIENNLLFNLFNEAFKDESLLNKKSSDEKIELLKTIKQLKIDGSILNKQLIPEFYSLVDFAIENKSKLTEPVQQEMNEQEIMLYFEKNIIPILKTLCIVDIDSLKTRLTQRLTKFDRTIKTTNNLLNNNANEDLIKLKNFNNTQDVLQIIKIVELLNGISEMDNNKNSISLLINEMQNKNIDKLNFLSQKYLEILYSKHEIKNQPKGWDNNYVYTIPTFIDEGEDWHKEQFYKILANDKKDLFLSFIHNDNNSFGIANNKTKNIFDFENLNYNIWLNYDKEKELTVYNRRLAKKYENSTYSSSINPIEKMAIRLWNRDPKKDLFQGSSAVQCIALDGINKNAAIDELLYTYAQLIEIVNKTKNKSVGNACVYWIKDENNQKALLLDSVSVHPDYENDFILRNNLFDFIKEYANNVSNNPNISVYIGNNFNKFIIDDLEQVNNINCRILGDTNSKTVYLDAINANNSHSRYVKINPNKEFIMDLRKIK